MAAKKGNKNAGNALWKKGVSGNPNGRPPIPPEVKALKKLTSMEFILICSSLLKMTRAELEALIKQPADSPRTVLEGIIAKALFNANRSGDIKVLDIILDRLILKPRDDMKNQQSSSAPSVTFTRAPDKNFDALLNQEPPKEK